jgi:hypothetical protein
MTDVLGATDNPSPVQPPVPTPFVRPGGNQAAIRLCPISDPAPNQEPSAPKPLLDVTSGPRHTALSQPSQNDSVVLSHFDNVPGCAAVANSCRDPAR